MIKVGDWVKVEQTVGRVVHVYSPTEEWVAVKLDDVGIIDVRINTVTKLPIKFKGFNIVMDYAGNWDCYRNTKSIGKIHFVCIKKGAEYFTGFKVPHESFVIKYCNTVNDAKDWLELQYATMLAKARGLV